MYVHDSIVGFLCCHSKFVYINFAIQHPNDVERSIGPQKWQPNGRNYALLLGFWQLKRQDESAICELLLFFFPVNPKTLLDFC